MNLERRFHQEMLRIYDEAKGFNYYLTYFLRMVVDRGGLSAAKQLLSGSELSDSRRPTLLASQYIACLAAGTNEVFLLSFNWGI